MENKNGIYFSDVIMIFSKEALFSDESTFFDGISSGAAGKNIGRFCSGVLFKHEKTDKVKFSSSSPALLHKQLKGGRLFIK